MIREKDKPYFKAIKEISGDNVTSEQIDEAVYKINEKTGLYYTGQDIIRIMQFCDLINIQSHLGQPRQGQLINGGRLHKIQVFWN